MSLEKYLSPALYTYIHHREKIATIQHFLGYYGCVCITARYTLNGKTENWKESFEDAVCKTILRHPNLCAGILHEDTNDPIFIRLDSIDLSAHIEYKKVPCVDYDRSLKKILEDQHSQFFQNSNRCPAWKLIVVQKDYPNFLKVEFDAVFAFHHVLGDGKSGLIVHASISEALNSSKEAVKLNGRVLNIPTRITFPHPIEKQMDISVSWSFFLRRIWQHFDLLPAWMKAAPAWVPSPCLRKHIQNYRSRVKILSIDPDRLLRIRAASRKQGTTVTGLLQAIIIASLTRRVPEATSLTGGIPYSMRHLLEPTARDEMGGYVSGLLIQYPSTTISSLRQCKNDEELTDEVWKVARLYKEKMEAKLTQIPNDLDMGLLPWVKDPMGMFSAGIDRPRRMTFETSNVGVFGGSKVAGIWQIERILFSQVSLYPHRIVVLSIEGQELGSCPRSGLAF